MSSAAEQMRERVLRWRCRPPEDEETLERLMVAARRAAGDPTLWPAAAREVSTVLGGAAVLLTLRPPSSRDPSSVVSVGIAENFVRSYTETHYLHDPWVERMAGRPPGIVFGYELVPRWDLLRTIFYREWIVPQDLLPDLSIAGLLLQGPLSTFAAFRRRGTRLFKLEDLSLLRRLLPHLQQAVHNTRARSTRLS